MMVESDKGCKEKRGNERAYRILCSPSPFNDCTKTQICQFASLFFGIFFRQLSHYKPVKPPSRHPTTEPSPHPDEMKTGKSLSLTETYQFSIPKARKKADRVSETAKRRIQKAKTIN
jgi:hypothetical protein